MIHIRQISINDLPALQTIGRKTFVETFAEGNSKENLARYLAEGFSHEKLTKELENKNSQFYFAEMDGEVLGYLKVNTGDAQSEQQDPDALEIERIYVLRKFHGKVVGLALYEKAFSIAREKNVPYIWLGVWEHNPRAIRFYEKQGFEEFDKHIFQLGDDAQTDILMKLSLMIKLPNE